MTMLTWAITLTAAGVLADDPSHETNPLPDDRVVTTVDERISSWQLKPEEKRFDQIGWADDIRSALRLGREHNRAVFLFTMDGHVNTGRC